MALATNFKTISQFGYQLILSDEQLVLGVNLLYNDKILIKKRFRNPKSNNSKNEELRLVQTVVNDYFKINL